MGIKLLKILSVLRDVLSWLPIGGKPRLEFLPIAVQGIPGNSVDLTISGTPMMAEWSKEGTLRSLVPDPTNSVLLIFSGHNADAIRGYLALPPPQ